MSDCNVNCGCEGISYNPVCSNEDGFTNYFSPCHAGCSDFKVQEKNGTNITIFTDCSCLKSNTIPPPSIIAEISEDFVAQSGTVNSGVCPVDCSKTFIALIGFLMIFSLIGATTRIPNFLLSLRSIEMRDKSASITFSVSFLSAFAFLPSPIVYGAILDSTCKVWDTTKCGETTHCLIYDTNAMQNYFAFFPAAFIFLALLADAAIFHFSTGMTIYDDENTSSTEETKEELELKEKGFKEIDLNA